VGSGEWGMVNGLIVVTLLDHRSFSEGGLVPPNAGSLPKGAWATLYY